MTVRECRAELLVGCRVVDVEGQAVGRIEEIVAEYVDEEYVVREFHVGAFAAFERLGDGMLGRALLRLIGGKRIYSGYAVPWQVMDLTDPAHPRLTVAKAELRRLGDAEKAGTSGLGTEQRGLGGLGTGDSAGRPLAPRRPPRTERLG